jgi:hypothetical protein
MSRIASRVFFVTEETGNTYVNKFKVPIKNGRQGKTFVSNFERQRFQTKQLEKTESHPRARMQITCDCHVLHHGGIQKMVVIKKHGAHIDHSMFYKLRCCQHSSP